MFCRAAWGRSGNGEKSGGTSHRRRSGVAVTCCRLGRKGSAAGEGEAISGRGRDAGGSRTAAFGASPFPTHNEEGTRDEATEGRAGGSCGAERRSDAQWNRVRERSNNH